MAEKASEYDELQKKLLERQNQIQTLQKEKAEAI